MFIHICMLLGRTIDIDDVEVVSKLDASTVKSADDVLQLLQPIVTSTCFSKIRINIDKPCKMLNLAKKCTYKECVVPRDLEDEVKNYACRVGELYNNTCTYKDVDDPNAINVDLLKSTQTNSGYTDGAGKTWEKMHEVVQDNDLFARLLSGLHFSITVHIARFYYEGKPIAYNAILYTSKRTNAHVRNLVYTYKYVRQAFAKISTNMIACSIENTQDGKEMLENLVNMHKKEPKYSQKQTKDNKLHKCYSQLLDITNCIDCDKCKLWGIIQIKGLFAAYRLHNNMYRIGNMPGEDLIYLVNTYNKLAESIVYANDFDKIKCAYLYLFAVYSVEIATFAVTLLIFFAFCRKKVNKTKKEKKRKQQQCKKCK